MRLDAGGGGWTSFPVRAGAVERDLRGECFWVQCGAAACESFRPASKRHGQLSSTFIPIPSASSWTSPGPPPTWRRPLAWHCGLPVAKPGTGHGPQSQTASLTVKRARRCWGRDNVKTDLTTVFTKLHNGIFAVCCLR